MVPAPVPLFAMVTVATVLALMSTEGNVMVVPAVKEWTLPSAKV
jgi:hypothetical protein